MEPGSDDSIDQSTRTVLPDLLAGRGRVGVALTVALLLAPAVAAAQHQPCPHQRALRISLKQWRGGVARSKPGKYDAWLATLRLPPVHAQLYQTVKLDRVDVFAASLSGPDRRDRVVQVKFNATNTAGELVRVYRIQVLRRLSADSYCVISGDLSGDEPALTVSAKGQREEHAPTTFGFVNLTHTDRDTIEVVHTTLMLSSGSRRAHDFWDVANGRLIHVLQLRESEMRVAGVGLPFKREWYETSGTPPRLATQYVRSCKDAWPDRFDLAPRTGCADVVRVQLSLNYSAAARQPPIRGAGVTISAVRNPDGRGYYTLFGNCPVKGGVVDLHTAGGGAGWGDAWVACDNDHRWRYNEAYFAGRIPGSTYEASQAGTHAVYRLDGHSRLAKVAAFAPCDQPYRWTYETTSAFGGRAECHRVAHCSNGKPYVYDPTPVDLSPCAGPAD